MDIENQRQNVNSVEISKIKEVFGVLMVLYSVFLIIFTILFLITTFAIKRDKENFLLLFSLFTCNSGMYLGTINLYRLIMK
jgi:hypothetical protein